MPTGLTFLTRPPQCGPPRQSKARKSMAKATLEWTCSSRLENIILDAAQFFNFTHFLSRIMRSRLQATLPVITGTFDRFTLLIPAINFKLISFNIDAQARGLWIPYTSSCPVSRVRSSVAISKSKSHHTILGLQYRRRSD